MITNNLAKVILREHVEGSVRPALAEILAQQHHVCLPMIFLYTEDQSVRNAALTIN